jgi:transcriptional regulator with XRE-family HTH domain
MTPWSVADLLASDVMTWSVSQAAIEGGDVPAARYLHQLAERVGMSRAKLGRILAGEVSPTVAQLRALCQAIGSARAVAALAEECGLVVVGGLADSMEPTAAASRDGGARVTH